MTAIAALQCVERGQISLDEPVYEYLPELKDQPVVSLAKTGDGNEPELEFTPATHPMTLRHLLTHTSGLSSDFMNPTLMAWRKSRSETTDAFSGNAIKAFTLPLVFSPGQGWTYGAGYDAVGVLIARLNGVADLEDYMATHIFAPLGPKTATFMPGNHPTVLEHLVKTYTHDTNGKLVAHNHGTTGHNPTISQGGGGLYASVPDFTAILADIVAAQPKLLKPETAELLFTPQLQADTPAMKDLEASRPLLETLLGVLAKGVKANHALGSFLALEDASGVGKTRNTASWAGAPGTFWMMNRERRLVGVYGSQLFPIMDPTGLRLIDAFVREVWRVAES